MMSLSVDLRSYDELIAAFPNLGREGVKAEAQAALAADGSRYQFLDEAFRDPEMLAALQPWSADNTSIVRLSEAIFDKRRAAARQDLIAKRLLHLQSYGRIQGDIAAAAAKWVDDRLVSLDVMERSGRVFDLIERLHRGGAMRSDRFDVEFKQGEKLSWRRLTACTIDPDFTPIHYAWKQRNDLVKCEAPEDVTSYILEVQLDALPRPRLVWTGAVEGDIAASTYRWQAKVVTPPGFEFEITSVQELNQGSRDRLALVHATYVAPVNGSPASGP